MKIRPYYKSELAQAYAPDICPGAALNRLIAISLFLSLTNITNEEIILNAATITINNKIKNITLVSIRG